MTDRNDSELQREIEELLAVEPSPGLPARVRLSIERKPRAARFPYRWFAGSLAAAAAMLLVVFIPFRRDATEVSDPPTSFVHAGHDIELTATLRPLIPPRARTPARRVPRGLNVHVLISAEEAGAFQELVATVGKRRFEVVPSLVWDDAVSNVAMTPIVFDTIDLSPIDKGAF